MKTQIKLASQRRPAWLPHLKNRYYWQWCWRSSAKGVRNGAALFRDNRAGHGRREYLGYYSLPILEAIYLERPLESAGLTSNKLANARAKLIALRDVLKMIEGGQVGG